MSETAIKIVLAFIDLIGRALWPAAFITVLLSYRSSIVPLLARIGSAKFLGYEFVFQLPAADAPKPSQQVIDAEFQVGHDGFLTDAALADILIQSKIVERSDQIRGRLLVFSSASQRTWLLVDDTTVAILLDDKDTRNNSKIVQAVFAKADALPIKIIMHEGAPLLKFAAQRENDWWFYSTTLFPEPSLLRDAIERLLRQDK